MKRFEEKVVLVTGAASGLGKASVLRLAEEGAKLSLVDLNEEALEELKSEIQEQYPEVDVLTVTANVADEAAVKNYVDQTKRKFGKIDAFFNNAGIEGKQNLTEDYGADEFE